MMRWKSGVTEIIGFNTAGCQQLRNANPCQLGYSQSLNLRNGLFKAAVNLI